MLKKIEQWLLLIFAGEVAKVENNLKNYFNYELQRIETSFTLEREKYLAALASDLKQFRADLVAEKLLIAAPQHWRADADVVKADEALRHPRQARR